MGGSTGVALLLGIGAFTLLYAGFKGYDPRSLITSVFSGQSPTKLPGSTSNVRTPTSEPMTGGGNVIGQLKDVATGPGASTEGTKAVDRIVGALRVIPGWNIIRICGPGSVAGSQHPKCNAVDAGGPRAVLFAVSRAALLAAKAGVLPISEVIGPNNDLSTKGTIWTESNGWKPQIYTGPNSHQTHVHLSGKPLL